MEKDPQIMPEEEGIDLVEMAQRLWKERKLILKCCGVAVLVALVVAFSIPKEYTVTVKLAPEFAGENKSGGLGALASMAGFNIGNGEMVDAVYPDLYPDIVASVPFAVRMFDMKVTDKSGKMDMRLYDYIDNELSSPWWGAVTGLPGAAIGGLMSLIRSDEDSIAGDGGVNPFRLTKDEDNIVLALNDRIGVDVDSKSSVITISATMQDPVVAALVADSVAANLREFVTEYRTNKARQDLVYMQTLFDEAQADYFDAQARYAKYLDANHGIVLRSVRTEEERLQNEVSLAYSLYSNVAQRLQQAKAKIQENTPVYAVLQPATVPLKASKPSKVMILIGFVFLAFAGCSAWILFGRDFLDKFRKDLSQSE